MWFWVKDEWALAFLELPNFLNKLFKNKKGTGWPDKLCHLLLHLLMVLCLVLWFDVALGYAMLCSLIAGILYEWLVDCVLTKNGASKFDLLANIFGMLVAGIILYFRKN